MKAALFDRHGDTDVLTLADVAIPDVERDHVRVRVHACGINHLDLFVRKGIPGLELRMPHVGGSEIAGVVDTIGEGVEGWSTGDRVLLNPSTWCGRCEYCLKGQHPLCDRFRILGEHLWGGCAEYVIAPATSLLALPERISFVDAASTPLTHQTAYRALFTQAKLRIGETVLVLGASGGVAVAAIQMAKHAGATVFAVTSGSENVSKVEKLGADVVIDRNEASFSKEVWKRTNKRGVDVVLENVGQATWGDSLRCLARRGRLVTYGATTGPKGDTNINLLFWKQLEIYGSTMGTHTEFRAAMDLFFAGHTRPVVSHVLPLEELAKAHELLERGAQFGKIVMEVRPA